MCLVCFVFSCVFVRYCIVLVGKRWNLLYRWWLLEKPVRSEFGWLGWGRVGDAKEMIMTVVLMEKYNVNLILLFALDR